MESTGPAFCMLAHNNQINKLRERKILYYKNQPPENLSRKCYGFWYIGGVMHIVSIHTKRPILYERNIFFYHELHIYQMFSPYKSSFWRIYIFVADYEMKLIRFCLLGCVACTQWSAKASKIHEIWAREGGKAHLQYKTRSEMRIPNANDWCMWPEY